MTVPFVSDEALLDAAIEERMRRTDGTLDADEPTRFGHARHVRHLSRCPLRINNDYCSVCVEAASGHAGGEDA